MKAIPTHRYLIVEPYNKQEEERSPDSKFSGFVIPSEFYKTRHEMEPTELMKVVSIGPDCTQDFYEGQIVLVETRMLENHLTPYGQVIYIGENYIPIKFVE